MSFPPKSFQKAYVPFVGRTGAAGSATGVNGDA